MKIGSIILRTPDVDGATAFWSEVVGLEVLQQLPGYTFLHAEPLQIVLAEIDRPIDDHSFTEIVFFADDVRTEYAAMAERGVPFESELGAPIMSQDGKDLIAAHFQDPDGHYGRLTGWVASE